MRTTLFAEPDVTPSEPERRPREAQAPRRVRPPRSDVAERLSRDAERLVLVTSAPPTEHDLAELVRIARREPVEIRFRVPSADRRLAALLDPAGPAPPLRFAALRAARRAGLRAGVLVAPLVPGVNGHEVDLLDLFAQCRASGAEFVAAEIDVPAPDRVDAMLRALRRCHPRIAARYEVWLRIVSRSPREDRERTDALLAGLRRRFALPPPSGASPASPALAAQRTFGFAG
jgi:hypothetical protein